jgi:type IV pilus assembly protein PilQ
MKAAINIQLPVIICIAFFPLLLIAQDRSDDNQSVDAGDKGSSYERPPIERFSVTSADVKSVLKQLAEYSGVDIVISEKVTGTISLSLTHKTWKDILAIVCRMSNLTAIREKSYFYVIPTEEYQKENLSNASAQQQAQNVVELKREVVKIKNLTAEDMQKSISALLSSRGKITIVEHTNSLIIYDTDDNIRSIKKTISELDVETDQVSISCKILQVSSSVIQSLGIQWGYFDRAKGVDVSATHLSGSSVVSGALESITYGILSQDKLSFTLEYLYTNSKTEVVAQPQITTMDNKEAKIYTGSEVPVTYLDEASNTVVKMIDAGTELVVTPHITGNHRLMLNLNPKKSSYTMSNNEPVVSTQSAQTNIMVTDGETVVIAGLTSSENVNTDEGVPLLKDIPIIGYLFKRSKKTKDKEDLIIFVTPHIISKKTETSAVGQVPSQAVQHAQDKASPVNK